MRSTIPRMIENTLTGAKIIYGWSPDSDRMIRYHTDCACGSYRLELIAPPDTDPESYLWAAREQHMEQYPDCQHMDSSHIELPYTETAHLN